MEQQQRSVVLVGTFPWVGLKVERDSVLKSPSILQISACGLRARTQWVRWIGEQAARLHPAKTAKRFLRPAQQAFPERKCRVRIGMFIFLKRD
jgi:hypothetical protein